MPSTPPAPLFRTTSLQASVFDSLNRDLYFLYSKESQLGNWIRNKKSMIKIGDILFVHGGVSNVLLNYDLDISKVNSEIKRDIATMEFESVESSELLTKKGILWYRGLVESYDSYEKIESIQLDSVLAHFDCKKIAVGHTIVDSISTDFDGKVIRLDVDHYSNSSAFLIENEEFYIVNNKGHKSKL